MICVATNGAMRFSVCGSIWRCTPFYFMEDIMPNYEQLYFTLFNALTKVIESIDDANYGVAKALLIHAQQQAEEIYINADMETTADA